MEALEMILAAIKATPAQYLQQVLNSRNPFHPDQKGSAWTMPWSRENLLQSLEFEVISEFTPEGGGFVPRPDRPCKYFKVSIPGMLGVVPLTSLDQGVLVQIADPKGTCGSPGGGVEAHLPYGGDKLGKVDHSTFILGPSETPEGEYILWTAHPGDPSPRYTPVDRPDLIGVTMTAQEAMGLGLTMVNLR